MTTEDFTAWRASERSRVPLRPETVAIAAIVGIGLGLRLVGINQQWLWYDDIFGPLFGRQSFFDLLVCIARFDIHPPLWNFQLQLWGLFGSSDTWYMLNSVLWSVASIGSLYAVTRRRFGPLAALTGAGILAFHPLAVMFAQQVRMYPMLMVLLIWGWEVNHRYLAEGAERRTLWWVSGIGLAIVYTHGTGLLLACYLGVYGLFAIARERPELKRVRAWLIAQGVIVLLGVPAVVNAMIRSVEHVVAPGWQDIMHTLSALLLGPTWTGAGEGFRATWIVHEPLPQLASVAFLLLVGGNLYFKRNRAVVGAMVLFPLVFTALISFTIKPIWYIRTFVPLIPFVALAIGLLLASLAAKLPNGFTQGPAMVVTIAVCAFTSYGMGRYLELHKKPTNFEAAMADIEEARRPGDIIWVPLHFDFWAAAWYWAGPDWGSPLAVQDALGPREGKWKQVLERTDRELLETFHLIPETDFVEKDGTRMYVGRGAFPKILEASPERIFVVQTDLMEETEWTDEEILDGVERDFTTPIELPGYELEEKHGYTRLWVKHYVRTSTEAQTHQATERAALSAPESPEDAE